MEVSREQEIQQIEAGAPHVVILGAGASYAAFPYGDKNGHKLPLMNNFVETFGIEELVNKSGLSFSSTNFEDIYSSIYAAPELIDLRTELEEVVYAYFQEMELPDTPTIYDHLVLSLRNKDFIATFNWDPFLVQAIRRNGQHFKLPRPIFLHGNVAVGYCKSGHMMGNSGALCSFCGERLVNTPLLYPVAEKGYQNEEFISRQWGTLEAQLKRAFMVTIFGYGAPASDTAAIELLKNAWGSPDSRNMEEFEIIDIRNEQELVNTWSPFLHSHHYQVEGSFYDSWIANHPRRTGEAYLNQFYYAKFIENNPLPKDAGFEGLWDWFENLQQVEDTKST